MAKEYSRVKLSNGLTPRQENFAQVFVKTGNASEAYRQSYSWKNLKSTTINRNASGILANDKVLTRIRELNAEIESKSIADAKEIQQLLTKLLRGEEVEEVPMMGENGIEIAKKVVTPKDRIKAGETLAKMRGYFNIQVNVAQVPIIKDDI